MHYNYAASKRYCEQIGLVWLGDGFIEEADKEAYQLNFTQEQVDAAMRHHLWQVKWLFTPRNYSYKMRILMAVMFIFGTTPKR